FGLSAAVTRLLLVALGLLTQQGAQPLRKAELVRLLATKARSKADVVVLLRRNCVTFRPSERDRADLRAAGADDAVLGAIDQCLRARAAPAPTPAPAPSRPPTPPPVAPWRVIVSAQVAAPAGGTVDIPVQLYRGADPKPGVELVLRGHSAILGGPPEDPVPITDWRCVPAV